MRNFPHLIICLFIAYGQVADAQSRYNNQADNNQKNKSKSFISSYITSEPPFIIHYGLNDSHSRSWVQINSEDVIGIVYFQRFTGSRDEGTLIYKTIFPDGTGNEDQIIEGRRLEKSVLLYDSLDSPHIFVAHSNSTDQVIDHYFKNDDNEWQSETIIHYYNEGGKFIYEISADKGPDDSFHLLVLKTPSDVDSDDFLDAWINSYLYHLTNRTGNWEKELIYHYNTAYTYDMCMKSSIRQDIKVDNEGCVHVTFSEQLNGVYDPSYLWYATNKTGSWEREIVLSYDPGTVDDAGWFPSLCLDNDDIPYIACNYLKRVSTHSVTSYKLLLLKRLGSSDWSSEIVAEHDDGYHGNDGRNYTGALCHLLFDENNRPNIVFSDVAATHWDYQRMNVGNIRFGIRLEGHWNLTTIYRQPLPTSFFNATEMQGMCLIISGDSGTIRVIGQELKVTGENQYSSNLLNFDVNDYTSSNNPIHIDHYELKQNYPNPFNPTTTISYTIPFESFTTLKVYDVLGNHISTLVEEEKTEGNYSIYFNGAGLPSGIYFYQIKAKNFIQTKKMVLIK